MFITNVSPDNTTYGAYKEGNAKHGKSHKQTRGRIFRREEYRRDDDRQKAV